MDITTHEQLRELYRAPSARVQAKKAASIDPASAELINSTPFFLVATADANGRCDVSPRGGPPGQLRVLSETTVAFPDLSGNNLIDTLQNIVDNPHAGLLVLTPGRDETLRVEGSARITTAESILELWDDLVRRPKCAVVIDVDHLFLHCAKAFRRGEVWNPASWSRFGDVPDAVESFLAATGMDVTASEVRAMLEASYTSDLAEERPV